MSQQMKAQRDEEVQDITSCFFDSRIDATLVPKEINGRVVNEPGREEHYALCSEPGGKCFSHICPELPANDHVDEDQAASDIRHGELVADCICQELSDLGVSKSQIVALGADSTYVNTGNKAGIICWIEKKWNKRLHHIICLQHINELPTKRLMKVLDGPTTCANKFSGPIGKHLSDVEDQPIDPNFVPIRVDKIVEIPPEIVAELNSDFKYLYRIYKVVVTGEIPDNFSLYSIADLNHARWTTTCSRLMRYLISNPKLDDETLETLRTIVKYIVSVYIPIFFMIRSSSTWLDAPKIYLELLKRLRQQSPDVQAILQKSIQLGAYCLHEETLLLTLLSDPDEEIRRFAIRAIEDIRIKDGNPNIGNPCYRKKETPKINFNAETLKDLINWKRKGKFFEPLLTCHLTTEELRQFHSKPYELASCHRFPCTTQAVERAVREVSLTCQQVSTKGRRVGWMLSRQEARKVLPKNTKAGLMEMVKLGGHYKKPGV